MSAQKTADRPSSEMATDGTNDVVQVVRGIQAAVRNLLKVLVCLCRKQLI